MKTISTNELENKMKSGENLNIIDVREKHEVLQGMIQGALHIPLGDIPSRMNELDKGKAYIMVCRSGGRSGNAAGFLEENGFDVTNMSGGMLAWEGDTV